MNIFIYYTETCHRPIRELIERENETAGCDLRDCISFVNEDEWMLCLESTKKQNIS